MKGTGKASDTDIRRGAVSARVLNAKKKKKRRRIKLVITINQKNV